MKTVDKTHNEPAFTPAALPVAIAAAMKSSSKAGKADLKAGDKLFAAVQEHNQAGEMEITAERLSSKFESSDLILAKTMKAWRIALMALAIEGAASSAIAKIFMATDGKPAKRLNSTQKKLYAETRPIWNTKFENLKKRLETAETDALKDSINAKLEADEELTDAERLVIDPPKESVTAEIKKAYDKLHRLLDASDEKNDKYHYAGLDVTGAATALNAFGLMINDAIKRQVIESDDNEV